MNDEVKNKNSILYIPDPEPDLHYETIGKVEDNTTTVVTNDGIPDLVTEIKKNGDAILSAMAYMPKNINTIIESTITKLLEVVDTPINDPYLPAAPIIKETPNAPPVFQYEDEPTPSVSTGTDEASTTTNTISEDATIVVPDFFPPAPNVDVVASTYKPLYQIASDTYTSDMYDVKQYFVNKLQDSMTKYFSEMIAIKNECGIADILTLTGDFDAVAANVTNKDLVHLADFITRSQIVREQKSKLFNKTHNTNQTLYQLRACLAAYTQRSRYYQASYGKSDTYLATQSNGLLLESRQTYDKKYKSTVYNLFKYLDSSVLIIDDNLKMSLKEAQAKGHLYKNGVNILLKS